MACSDTNGLSELAIVIPAHGQQTPIQQIPRLEPGIRVLQICPFADLAGIECNAVRRLGSRVAKYSPALCVGAESPDDFGAKTLKERFAGPEEVGACTDQFARWWIAPDRDVFW